MANPRRQFKYPNLWNGLVLAYTAGLGSTGNIVQDRSAFGNNGTLTGFGVGRVATSQGESAFYYSSGTGEYLSMPSSWSTDLFPKETATFSVWLRRINHLAVSAAQTGSWKITDTGNTHHYTWTDGNIYEGTWRNTRINLGSGSVTDRTRWHHYAVTRSPDSWKVYQNGKEIYSTTPGTFSITATGWVGQGRDATARFYGYQTDYRFYNRQLPQQEIRQLAKRVDIAYELADTHLYSSANIAWTPADPLPVPLYAFRRTIARS